MTDALPDIVPLFSSAVSLKDGGLFTVEKAGVAAKAGRTHGAVSLCDLAKEHGLKQLHLVDDRFANFFALQKNLKDIGCQLVFGLKMTVADDISDKSEASLKTESKVVIWMNGDGGMDYQTLIDFQTVAAQQGFYYQPRIDWKVLKAGWHKDLILSLPFYSSFLARNALSFASIVPDLPVEPLLLREVDQRMPADDLLDDALARYSAATGAQIQQVKSVYYRNREDARAFQAWRCLLNRTSHDKPNDSMVSREFCWEAYQELVAPAADMREAA